MSTLTHFPFEPGCKDYSFLDKAVEDLKHGLDSILTDCHVSLVSSVCLYLFFILSANSRPQLTPRIKSCKLWHQARALPLPVTWTGKMLAFMLICYFSSHPAAFCFLASSPPHDITLNSANFQSGIGAAAHATLDTEQLSSHIRAALVDTVVPLQDSDGGVILASEVHELLTTKIQNIKNNNGPLTAVPSISLTVIPNSPCLYR